MTFCFCTFCNFRCFVILHFVFLPFVTFDIMLIWCFAIRRFVFRPLVIRRFVSQRFVNRHFVLRLFVIWRFVIRRFVAQSSLLPIRHMGVIYDCHPHGYALFIAIWTRVKMSIHTFTLYIMYGIPIDCLIIVHFSALEMYSRFSDPVTGSQHRSKSIEIIHHKLCTWFRLSIGLLKAYCR